MMVRVIGLGKALRIDFDEVLVKAELMYQTRHSTWYAISNNERRRRHNYPL